MAIDQAYSCWARDPQGRRCPFGTGRDPPPVRPAGPEPAAVVDAIHLQPPDLAVQPGADEVPRGTARARARSRWPFRTGPGPFRGARPWRTTTPSTSTSSRISCIRSCRPTTLWGYNPTLALGVGAGAVVPQAHLGGIIIAQRGKPTQVTFRNNLPDQHILPVDSSIQGADPSVTQNRTSTHLHGGLVPWISDGGPFSFWDRTGNKGITLQEQRGSSTPRVGRGQHPRQRGGILLPQRSERPPHVVPRPCHGHHSPQCLRRRRHRLHHPGQVRSQPW